MMNGWNLAISVNVRCNNDCKILTNGGDIKNIIWYVTSYMTKKQAKSHSLSVLMVKSYAFKTDYLRNIDTNSLQDT